MRTRGEHHTRSELRSEGAILERASGLTVLCSGGYNSEQRGKCAFFGHAKSPANPSLAMRIMRPFRRRYLRGVTVLNPAANRTGATSGVTDAESDATASRNDYRA